MPANYIAERPLRLFIPKSKVAEYEARGWSVRKALEDNK